MDRSDDFERGVLNRRAVLGDAWVDQSLGGTTQFNADFQDLATATSKACPISKALAAVEITLSASLA